MGTSVDCREELLNLAKDLPVSKIHELLDFAQFLKVKSEGFRYSEVKDSGIYVREMRKKEERRVKSSENFIEELMEWQRSNS